jgi:hypothetical protein
MGFVRLETRHSYVMHVTDLDASIDLSETSMLRCNS